jgi:oligoribonuclease
MIARMSDAPDRMVWVDLEMTGLDPERCAIVEIATVVTDFGLNVIAEGPCLVVHQPDDVLAKMDAFVVELHTRSGLIERIRASTTRVEEAERATLEFVAAHCTKGTAPLCGNSIYKDRSFLERYMPAFVGHLHYRMVDVSTIKELVRRWYPPALHAPKKKETHRALDDIRESIAELAYYREHVFRPAELR